MDKDEVVERLKDRFAELNAYSDECLRMLECSDDEDIDWNEISDVVRLTFDNVIVIRGLLHVAQHPGYEEEEE